MRVTDDEDYVVLRTSDGFALYDVTNAADPSFVAEGTIQDNVAVRDIATRGAFVYVSSSNGKVFVFDISNPAEPLSVMELDLGLGAATVMHPGADFLYVILEGTLNLVADLPGYCESVCGNGVVEHPEACDDGNLDPADGCDADCTL